MVTVDSRIMDSSVQRVSLQIQLRKNSGKSLCNKPFHAYFPMHHFTDEDLL